CPRQQSRREALDLRLGFAARSQLDSEMRNMVQLLVAGTEGRHAPGAPRHWAHCGKTLLRASDGGACRPPSKGLASEPAQAPPNRRAPTHGRDAPYWLGLTRSERGWTRPPGEGLARSCYRLTSVCQYGVTSLSSESEERLPG